MSPLETLLAKLPDARKVGEGWSAKCPAHDDEKASLCFAQGDDGKILVKCHAGCDTSAVVAKLGLTMRDLFPSDNGKARMKIVAEYDYTNADGKLLFQVVRLDPK